MKYKDITVWERLHTRMLNILISVGDIQLTMSQIALDKTKEVASYMRLLYTAEVAGRKHEGDLPNWSIDLLQDCRYAAKVIALAVKNESKSACGLRRAGLFTYICMVYQGGQNGQSMTMSLSCATLPRVVAVFKIRLSGNFQTYFRQALRNLCQVLVWSEIRTGFC